MKIIRRLLALLLPADPIAHFLPIEPEQEVNKNVRRKRYKRFRNSLFFAMNFIGFIPMILIAALGFSQYQDLLQKEELDQLHWNMEGAQKTIEAFVGELQAVVNFVAHEDRYEELLDQENLRVLFGRLQEQYGNFVDLGVIDPHGRQRSYVGPYSLLGADYSQQDWFRDVSTKKVHISSVFTGVRQVPHFAIRVTKKVPGTDKHWVLRATINAETLQDFIETINTKASDDIFIVNSDGILQTSSLFYGKVLDKFLPCSIPPAEGQIRQVIDKHNNSILHAGIPLKGTPWILVLTKEGYIYGQHWSSFRKKLFFIFAGCSIVGLLITVKLSDTLTNLIRESDKKRQAFLSEAEHSNKLASIGRLAAGVAHEINNPLAVIDQKAGLVQDILELTEDFSHKEKVGKSLLGIHDGVNRCKVITHRLLGFARRMDVVTEEININDLLQEVAGFLEKEALYNHIRIEYVLQEDLPLIQSDRGQLQQIFLNILNNALDAIGQNGRIVLTSEIEKDQLLVGIMDDGPGIPTETLQHIFEPFFTTKDTGKGTGLGLSITYGLVKKLGGTIRATSEVGVGAFFEVYLPLPASPESSEEENE